MRQVKVIRADLFIYLLLASLQWEMSTDCNHAVGESGNNRPLVMAIWRNPYSVPSCLTIVFLPTIF